MKSFLEYAELEEGIFRTSAITAYGAKARRDGDDSVQAFKQGKQALRKGGPDVTIEERVKRIEQSMDHLLDGLIAQRQQIGAGVAVDVVGHSMAAKTRMKS